MLRMGQEIQPGIVSARRKGESEFAGGVSDGTFGVAAFELKREALRGRKAWFFFSDMVVCLGADIQCDSEYDVVTTLNQCRMFGTVVGDNPSEVIPEGDITRDLQWVHHDGIGYLFPEVQTVELSTGKRTGSWKRISYQERDRTVTDKVFSLAISHGAEPEGVGYAYAVFPGTEAADMPDLAGQMPFEIVENSEAQQAVWCERDEVLGIVFRKPGRIEAVGWQVEVDRACALLLRHMDGIWTLSAADPAAGSGVLNITISHDGAKPQQVTLTLPEDLMAGASVSKVL